jgi:catechol-2,3-dioxygenase
MAIKPRIRRTHLALLVSDHRRLARWYVDVLGMEVTAETEQWTFLSFGLMHHDIALIEASAGAARGSLGLQHYGLEIDGDLDDLRRFYAQLLDAGVQVVKTTDHGVGTGVYFEDPDGNRLELFCESSGLVDGGKELFRQLGAPSDPVDLDPLRD